MSDVFKKIAVIRTDMPEKFGLPRQSGAVPLAGRIVFESEFRRAEAVRGLEGFSHIWILWKFSGFENSRSLTVRPPKLGGNRRVGVFATRSPNRPNPVGLSAVKLVAIDTESGDSPALIVSGADMTDGTEIYDIKPYLPESDCINDAVGGFTEDIALKPLNVVFSADAEDVIGEENVKTVAKLLAQDPRPGYADDPERIYGLRFKEFNIKFRIDGETVFVTGAEKL